MNCAEINSSFYRPHRASTYARWAASTPEDFRFSVKVPKAITHECGLMPTTERVTSFIEELEPLGAKLGPLLLQFPPKQPFAEPQARSFFATMRDAAPGYEMVLEPRHPGWFTAEAGALLRTFQVARVTADPTPSRISAGRKSRAVSPTIDSTVRLASTTPATTMPSSPGSQRSFTGSWRAE